MVRAGPGGDALAVAGALVTGASSTIMQLAGTSASTVAFYRCLYALPFLLLLARRESKRPGRLSPRQAALGVGAGAFLAADLILWFDSIRGVGAGLATVLQDSQVMFVAAGGWLAFGTRPSPRLMRLLPVMLAGVWLVSGQVGGGSLRHVAIQGTLSGVASALAYAVFLLLIGRNADSRHQRNAAFMTLVTASTAVSAFVAGAATGTLRLVPTWPSAGWLILLAITTQVLGWLLIATALTRSTSAQASVALLLQPTAAVLLAWAFLSERPAPVQLGGVVIVVAAATVAVRSGPGPATVD